MNPVLSPLQFGTCNVTPPLILAPMAGITHSAFRRLIAHFGGCGALTTEMVPVTAMLTENFTTSPMICRRKEEGTVIYQIVIMGNGSLEAGLKRLLTITPDAIDVNLGCPAPMIARRGGGKALYDDFDRLKQVLSVIRDLWHGPFTIKCRLGHENEQWQELFLARLELFKSIGIDGLTVHPRFFHEKLKRKARWNLFPWIKSNWQKPLIGNGDMVNATALTLLNDTCCDGLMIGRAAIKKPWIFKELCEGPQEIDYLDVWNRFADYTAQDFAPEKAMGRVREFTTHFAENFFFGHELFRISRAAKTFTELRETVSAFLSAMPRVSR